MRNNRQWLDGRVGVMSFTEFVRKATTTTGISVRVRISIRKTDQPNERKANSFLPFFPTPISAEFIMHGSRISSFSHRSLMSVATADMDRHDELVAAFLTNAGAVLHWLLVTAKADAVERQKRAAARTATPIFPLNCLMVLCTVLMNVSLSRSGSMSGGTNLFFGVFCLRS